MFYHVSLKLSPKAEKHFGVKDIVDLDITDKEQLIKNLVEPIKGNAKFNFKGYRNIDPDDITRVLISETPISSDDWVENKMAQNGNGVYVYYYPEMIFGAEMAKNITDELLS